MIGLSGLLVKSAQQMLLTAQDLRAADISLPILVGGAALTRRFTDERISPEYSGPVIYAKDAMIGLSLANQVMEDPDQFSIKKEPTVTPRRAALAGEKDKQDVSIPKRSNIAMPTIFRPIDCKPHILQNIELDFCIPYINWQMLLGHHLGLKGKVKKLLAEGNDKAISLKTNVDELFQEAKKNGWFKPSVIYQFFPAVSEGNQVHILHPEQPEEIIETFTFPRQNKEPYLCLADYVTERNDNNKHDYIALFAVTAGSNVRQAAQNFKKEGEYFNSHAIQSMALELAEGLAERTHQTIRDHWGFPDHTDFTMQDRLQARYQGQRFSFGYPACPNLEDQEKLFRLLQPEKIGIQLTEGFMMEPEASVTAFVVSHPEARYFNVL